MNTIKYSLTVGFAVLTLLITMPGPAMAVDGSITILEPVNGAVSSGDELKYDVVLSPSGNHLHVYVDDQSPMIVRKVKDCPCSVSLPMLGAGKHTIVIKEATASHALTGLESTVTFTVK